jgi:hypothetical protein
MFYSFARVSAVLKLKVDDYYHNGSRRRLILHEKGGKEHEMPVHHLLEEILNEYIVAAGLQNGQPLFQAACLKVLIEEFFQFMVHRELFLFGVRATSTVIGYLWVSTSDQNIEKNKTDILHSLEWQMKFAITFDGLADRFFYTISAVRPVERSQH